MQRGGEHSTIKGLLLKLREWSRASLHGHPYKLRHKVHGRPDAHKDVDRRTIRRPDAEP